MTRDEIIKALRERGDELSLEAADLIDPPKTKLGRPRVNKRFPVVKHNGRHFRLRPAWRAIKEQCRKDPGRTDTLHQMALEKMFESYPGELAAMGIKTETQLDHWLYPRRHTIGKK